MFIKNFLIFLLFLNSIIISIGCHQNKFTKKVVDLEKGSNRSVNSGNEASVNNDDSDKTGSHDQTLKESCLKKVPSIIANYFEMDFNLDEWNEAWSCVDRTIVDFTENVEGKKENQYKTKELKTFFETYVFKKEISNELIQEIMLLKQAFVGGTTDVVTFVEIDKIRLVLKKSSVVFAKLQTQISILLLNSKLDIIHDIDIVKINVAIEELKKAINEILDVVPLQVFNYPIPKIQLLIREIKISNEQPKSFLSLFVLNNNDTTNPLDNISEDLPFYEKIKLILVGNQVEVNNITEVKEVWNVLADFYKSYLLYHYGVDKLSITDPMHLEKINHWIEFNFKIANDALNIKKSHVIDIKELDNIIDAIYNQGYQFLKLDSDLIKSIYKILLSDVIKNDPNHISNYHLAWFQREYNHFYLIQSLLATKFQKQSEYSPQEMKEFIATYNYHKISNNLMQDIEKELFEKSWLSFVYFITNSESRFWNSNFQLEFNNEKRLKWNYTDLLMHNILVRGVQNLILLFPTNTSSSIFMRTFTQEDFRFVFEKYKDIGIKLKIFDKRKLDTSLSFINEGDLFTYSGNGDGNLDILELSDRVAIVYSAGTISFNFAENYFQTHNLYNKYLDIFKWFKIDSLNFKKSVLTNFSIFYPQLPQMGYYISNLDEYKWNNFYIELINLSSICPKEGQGIDGPSRRAFGVVLQYIEQLFILFDKNKSGFFEENEVDFAYPRFSTFLTKKTKEKIAQSNPITYKFLESIGFDWYNLSHDVFKFLISKGRTPTAGEIIEIKNNSFFWGTKEAFVPADRFQLSKVFTSLDQEMGTSKAICDLENN